MGVDEVLRILSLSNKVIAMGVELHHEIEDIRGVKHKTVSWKTNKEIYNVSLLQKELSRGKSMERIIKEGRVPLETIRWALDQVEARAQARR